MLVKKDTGRNSSFIESIWFTSKTPFSPFNLSHFPPPHLMTPEPSTVPYSTPPIIIVIIIHPVSTRALVQYRYRTVYHPSSRYRTNESEKRKKTPTPFSIIGKRKLYFTCDADFFVPTGLKKYCEGTRKQYGRVGRSGRKEKRKLQR